MKHVAFFCAAVVGVVPVVLGVLHVTTTAGMTVDTTGVAMIAMTTGNTINHTGDNPQ